MTKNYFWQQILVNFHCLYKIFSFKEDHRVCVYKENYPDSKFKKCFCSCGYLNDNVTFSQFLKKQGNKK